MQCWRADLLPKLLILSLVITDFLFWRLSALAYLEKCSRTGKVITIYNFCTSVTEHYRYKITFHFHYSTCKAPLISISVNTIKKWRQITWNKTSPLMLMILSMFKDLSFNISWFLFTLQVNFFEDHTKVILSHNNNDHLVTYINESRTPTTYRVLHITHHGCTKALHTRLSYARHVLYSMMGKGEEDNDKLWPQLRSGSEVMNLV